MKPGPKFLWTWTNCLPRSNVTRPRCSKKTKNSCLTDRPTRPTQQTPTLTLTKLTSPRKKMPPTLIVFTGTAGSAQSLTGLSTMNSSGLAITCTKTTKTLSGPQRASIKTRRFSTGLSGPARTVATCLEIALTSPLALRTVRRTKSGSAPERPSPCTTSSTRPLSGREVSSTGLASTPLAPTLWCTNALRGL